MDPKSQELFDQIVDMDAASLNREQLEFLMARRGYMNDAQRKFHAVSIKKHEAGELFVGSEGKELSDMTLDELKEEAEKRGVDITGLKTKKAILEAINA